jgi:hypothetical protein
MKKAIVILFTTIATLSFSSTSSTGATGTLDFPNAYTLRENNYSVTGILDRIESDARIGFMLEGGFIKQLEAGLKLSTKDRKINKDFVKSNIKFQFLQEGKNNPAVAIGFVESDESAGGLTGDSDKGSAYGYIVATKRFQILSSEVEDKNGEGQLRATVGIKYDDIEDLNLFTGIEMPILQKLKVLAEIYSYKEYENYGGYNESSKRKISVTAGGEFYTTNNITTKIFWRERNDSFGLSITYLGIYR